MINDRLRISLCCLQSQGYLGKICSWLFQEQQMPRWFSDSPLWPLYVRFGALFIPHKTTSFRTVSTRELKSLDSSFTCCCLNLGLSFDLGVSALFALLRLVCHSSWNLWRFASLPRCSEIKTFTETKNGEESWGFPRKEAIKHRSSSSVWGSFYHTTELLTDGIYLGPDIRSCRECGAKFEIFMRLFPVTLTPGHTQLGVYSPDDDTTPEIRKNDFYVEWGSPGIKNRQFVSRAEIVLKSEGDSFTASILGGKWCPSWEGRGTFGVAVYPSPPQTQGQALPPYSVRCFFGERRRRTVRDVGNQWPVFALRFTVSSGAQGAR